MPSQTTFAKLSLYNNTTDALSKYGEFRAAIAGIDGTSNMNKIDKLLQQNDTEIQSLKSKDVEVDGKITEINQSITELTGSVATNTNDISSIKEKNLSQDEVINQNSSDISLLSSRVSQNESNISQNANDITSINQSLNTLESTVSQNQSQIIDLQSSKATTTTYTATISTTWTGEQAPYTQSISVSGILSTDNPLVDIILNNDNEIAKSEIENYGKISRIQTTDGSITVTCLEDKPEVEMNIQLKVVR